MAYFPKHNIKSVTFFFPSMTIGGSDLLFVRLAQYFSETLGIKVYYIEHENGVGERFLRKNENLEFILYDYEKGITIDYETHLISSLHINWLAEVFTFTEQVKLFFWSIHPYGMVYLIPFTGKFIDLVKPKVSLLKKYSKFLTNANVERYRKAVQLMYSHRAIAFMDGANFHTNNNFFDLNIDKAPYLPIPLPEGSRRQNFNLIEEDVIHIGCLGRLVDFKIFPLINVIENANRYADQQKKEVRIHIIGEGNKSHLLEKIKLSSRVKLIHLGTVTGNDLDKYLVENIDILFAMGTSCLESAKLAIPSVLIDFNLGKINFNYKFKWLFETTEYTLGECVSDLNKPHKHTFKEILDEIYVYQNKTFLGTRCYDYFQEHHSIEKIAEKLLEYLSRTTLTPNELFSTNFHHKSFIHRIHSFSKKLIKV